MVSERMARLMADALVDFCENTGCLYCPFCDGEKDNDQVCKIGKPRSWEGFRNENSNGTGQDPDDVGVMQTGLQETVNDEILPD